MGIPKTDNFTVDAPQKRKGKFRCYKRNIREAMKIRAKSYMKPLKNTYNEQIKKKVIF